MSPPVFRLVLCASLFGLWMGYLAYLVATRPLTSEDAPLVVSRPQILNSEVEVVAQVDKVELAKDEIEVTVLEVKYLTKGVALEEGKTILVRGLNHAAALPRGEGKAKGTLVLTPDGIGRVTKADKPDDKDNPDPAKFEVKLADGKSATFASIDVVTNPDWVGPGKYLLPLRQACVAGQVQEGRYEVATVPPSPGFVREFYRIYPATAEALAQHRKIRNAR